MQYDLSSPSGIVWHPDASTVEGAITQRLNDGHAKALITVDGSPRRGKTVAV